MARNEEKANSMMNKWVTMKEGMAAGGIQGRRPFLASECDDIGQCMHWRRQILRETTRKITEIQNAGLGEHRIRDLNDEINKLIRERFHWERRIRELNGPDMSRSGTAMTRDGKTARGGRRGYQYFGAAKDLPGVRELFEEKAPPKPKRTRADMYRNVTPDYYGYRDEDDGTILLAEAEAETKAVAEAVEEWRVAETARKKARLLRRAAAGTTSTGAVGDSDSDSDAGEAEAFKAHVAVPSQEEVAKAVVEAKKAALLAKYASKGLQDSQRVAKAMLNVKD